MFQRLSLVCASLCLTLGSVHAAGTAAVVNDVAIPETQVRQLLATNQALQRTAKGRDIALNTLIDRELLVQAARQEGLDKSPAVKSAIEAATKQILAKAFTAHYLKAHPVSDEAIQARYKALVKAMPAHEYRLRHILVQTEDEAEDIVAELGAGKSFEVLARRSLDTATAMKGGELGWVIPNVLRPELAAEMAKLKVNETSAPIRTAKGWEILRVEEMRPAKVPSLQQAKPGIQVRLQQEAMQKHLAKMRTEAKIKILSQGAKQ